MSGDQRARARGDTKVRRPVRTEGGVVFEQIISMQGSTSGPGANALPEPGGDTPHDHFGDPVQQPYPAHPARIDLAKVMQERGDKQIGIALAPRGQRAQHTHGMALIGRRELAESGELHRGQHSRGERAILCWHCSRQCLSELPQPIRRTRDQQTLPPLCTCDQ